MNLLNDSRATVAAQIYATLCADRVPIPGEFDKQRDRALNLIAKRSFVYADAFVSEWKAQRLKEKEGSE